MGNYGDCTIWCAAHGSYVLTVQPLHQLLGDKFRSLWVESQLLRVKIIVAYLSDARVKRP